MGNKHYWVYIHINKKNGKLYVGQTRVKDPRRRWKGGAGYPIDRQPLMGKAIKKYGWDCFDHIVMRLNSIEEMDACEEYLISLYDTTNPNKGYNIRSGGAHPTGSTKQKATIIERYAKAVCQYTADGVFIKEWVSVSEAARCLNIYPQTISSCCRGKAYIAGGFAWRYRGEGAIKMDISDEIALQMAKLHEKRSVLHKGTHRTSETKARMSIAQSVNPICQYDLDGNFIREFMSSSEAGRVLGVDPGCILKCCKGKKSYSTVRGYIWRFKTEGYMNPIPVPTIGRAKPVCRCTREGVVIDEYANAAEAARVFGFRRERIFECCKGTRKSAYGYTWKFKD